MKKFITILLFILASLVSYGQDSTEVNNNNEVVEDSTVVSDTTQNVQNDSSYVKVKLDSLYPQPLMSGDSVIGVLFTVEQARKIDNDYELFYLMDSIITQYGVNDSITLGVINAQGKKITSLEMQVENLNTMVEEKKDMLINRDLTIRELKSKLDFAEEQIKLHKEKEVSYQNEIKDLKKEVRKQKIQKIVGYISTGILATGVVILGVFVGK